MLQGEHSAILSTFMKLPFVIKVFVLSIFEWPLKTGFTVQSHDNCDAAIQDLCVAGTPEFVIKNTYAADNLSTLYYIIAGNTGCKGGVCNCNLDGYRVDGGNITNKYVLPASRIILGQSNHQGNRTLRVGPVICKSRLYQNINELWHVISNNVAF